ncbi:MAG TPA: hypothetical protein VLL52_13840 [Anaerolineae bacterium]|nr:hypothetical protein [Anaerolineae bacterium]
MFDNLMKGDLNPNTDPAIAIILEIVGGLVGLFGLGWIYAGDRDTGLVFLLGGLLVLWGGGTVMGVGLFALSVVTLGIGSFLYLCYCFVPLIVIGFIAYSAMNLNNRLQGKSI